MELSGNNWKKYVKNLDSLGVPQNERRNLMKRDLYPLPDNANLDEAADEELIAFTFVRNPFDRFASAYYDKMVGKNWRLNTDLKRTAMRNRILGEIRGIPNPEKDPKSCPTPEEMVKFTLKEMNRVTAVGLDPHWVPQWATCPFCRINFDLVGKLETFDEDLDILFEVLQFDKVITRKKQTNVNKKKKKGNKTREFFSQVPQNLVKDLYEAYKLDFELFGYPKPNFKAYHSIKH